MIKSMRSRALGGTSGAIGNRKVIAIVAVGLVAMLALGYLALIGPQRSRAAELDSEIAATEQQVLAARAASVQPTTPTRIDRLFRLTKAVPDDADMPGLLLELSRLAAESGIEFDSITPTAAVASGSSVQAVPVQLAFRGNYYELSDFLFRLRTLVAKTNDNLDVSGRLYAVDGLDFAQGEGSQLTARVSAKAFVYGTGAAAPPPAAPAPATATTPAPAPTDPAGATG